MAFVLIGFMGSGKSTVAAELAAELGVTAVDSASSSCTASDPSGRRRSSSCASCSPTPARTT
jgi:predicted kinase